MLDNDDVAGSLTCVRVNDNIETLHMSTTPYDMLTPVIFKCTSFIWLLLADRLRIYSQTALLLILEVLITD